MTLGAPASLHALVSSRLDTLDPRERALVQNASVLGTSFSREGLLSVGVEGLDELLPSLVRKEIFALQTDPRSPERGQYRFIQAVVRQVAYDTLSRRDRKARHLAVAAHLQREVDPGHDLAAVIARHLLDAVALSSTDDDDVAALAGMARELLAVAAQRALSLGSPAEAMRQYTAGLSLPSDDVGATCRLHEGAAAAASQMYDSAAAHAHAAQALAGYAAVGLKGDEARAAALLGQALVQEHNLSDAIALLTPWYDALSEDPQNDRVVLLICEQLGRAHEYSGEHKEALQYFQRMMTLAEALEDKDQLVAALTSWATLWIIGGNPTAGLSILEGAVTLARELQRPSALIRPLNNTAAFLSGRDLPGALAAAEECLELATQAGFAQMMWMAAANVSLGLWNAGRWQELRERMSEDLAATPPSIKAFLRRRLDLATGNAPEATGDLDELGESEALQARAWYLGAVAAGLTAAADRARRAKLAADATRSLEALSGIDDDFVYQWTQAVEAAADLRDQDGVEDLLRIVSEQPAGLRSPLVRAEFLRLRATYAADAQVDPADDLRQAIAGFAALGAVFCRAQAEVVLAERLTQQGDHESAAPLLDAARTTFADLAAAPWIDRTERALSRV